MISRTNLLIFYRIFVLGIQNFMRNAWLTIIALIMMIVAITFALSGIVLNTTSQHVLSDLSGDLRVSVYLQPSSTAEDISSLRHAFEAHDNVDEVIYISSVEARAQFLENYGRDEQLNKAVEIAGDNVFPPSLEISVKDLDNVDIIEEIASEDKYSQIYDETSLGKVDAQNAFDRATDIQNFLIGLSIVLALMFGVIAILVIFNTIRIAIFSRSEEIQIMRLIGSPSHFIKGPFLIEASLLGIISGAASVGLIYLAIAVFSDSIQAVPELVESYNYFVDSPAIIFLMLAGSILGGVIIAIAACLWALQRYLKL